MSLITISKKSGKPKYKQIVSSIEKAIESGLLKKGDQIPSINNLRDNFKLSRDTVINAFNELKNRGIIHSIVGKGYYVSTENIIFAQKFFLLFDELNSFKEDLYNSFVNSLDDTIQVDIFFHHFNRQTFQNHILNNFGNYSKYIIMPANLKDTNEIIAHLPADKVYILDQTHKELEKYAAIYQNFEKDIFNSLTKAKSELLKYTKAILVFSSKIQPQGMKDGFLKFCDKNAMKNEIIETVENRKLEKSEVYIIPDDRNLIRIIKKIEDEKLILKKDIGIISYNDSLLKEVVKGGITTISTDFNFMGKNLAKIINTKKVQKIENPTKLILRNSL